MKHITNIEIRTNLYDIISQFYFNAKIKKYKHSYGWDEVLKDIQLSSQDKNLISTNKTTNEWLSNGYNVARNRRGWAFAYAIKDDTMYIYDAENCRNLTVDYQNTAPFTMTYSKNVQQSEWFPIGYKIIAHQAEDGYVYLYKNGQQLPNYRFNKIESNFRQHKNGEIYAIGLYGDKKFKITLDGIAHSLQESKLQKIIAETISKVLLEYQTNRRTKFDTRKLGVYNVVDGQWWDGVPHGLEHKGLVQDVRMYDKQTNDKTFKTIGLFRRCDNNKYFYAQIVPIANGCKDTKWEPLPLSKVPSIIKDDIRSINPQGHEPYLPV